MTLSDDFYKEEIREGYYVSPRRKRAWTVMLGILAEFDEFCRIYDLSYFVYYGTILGAIRHRGFIPWDDDLDVVMLREDYTKMQQLAPGYFKYPYRYEDAYSNTGHAWIISKIRDDRTTVLEGFGVKDKLFQSMYIDIHPWDDVPDQAGLGDITLVMSNELWMLVVDPDRARDMYNEGHNFAVGRDTIAGLLDASFDMRFKSFETFMTAIAGKSSKVNLLAEKFKPHGHPDNLRAWCTQTIRIPFEEMMVPVPVGYQQMMIDFFREYMRPVMHGSVHEGICIDPDHPYTEYASGVRDISELKPLEDGEKTARGETEAGLNCTDIDDRPDNNESDVNPGDDLDVSGSDEFDIFGLQKKAGLEAAGKTILVYTDASFLVTDPEHSLASIRRMLDIFTENKDAVNVIWYQGASDMELLSILPTEVVEAYLDLLDEFDRRGIGTIVQEDEEESALNSADAYYGDGSYLANACRVNGKPVMIRNITL